MNEQKDKHNMELFLIRRYLWSVSIIVLLICTSSPGIRAASFKYYVSPEGNDLWNGTSTDQPFATIHHARDVIRNVNKQGNSFVVYLRGGIYRLSETLIFRPEDSGTELYPVTYSAYPGEEPIITGSKPDGDLHLDQLLRFEGNPEIEKYVEYLIIRGITFSGSKSLESKNESASDPEISDNWGVNLKYARHCIFRENTIRNMTIPAFQMNGAENEITGNDIWDAVGGAIFVQGGNFTIRNNFIHDIHYADPEKPGWGICLGGKTQNAAIENNIVARAGVCLLIREKNSDISITNNVFVNGELSLLELRNPKNLSHENIQVSENIFYFRKSDVDLFNINGIRSVPSLSDNNIYWNPAGCICLNPLIWGIPEVAYMKEWQAMGFDTNSIIQDPLFSDVAKDDYSLKPESPALQLGFKPICEGKAVDQFETLAGGN